MLSGGGRAVHAQASGPDPIISQSESPADQPDPQQEPAAMLDTVEASDGDQEDDLPDPLEARKLPLATDTKGERPQSDPSSYPRRPINFPREIRI